MAYRKESLKKRLKDMASQLDLERSSFISHWRDLGDHILPRRPRFGSEDDNRGDLRNTKINDITATLAARSLRAGMMSGMTSPARPWFKLSTPMNTMKEMEAVKIWLDQVSTQMSTIFLKSNLYNVLPIVYGDIGVFGTSALLIEEDFESVLRCYPIPVGSYYIANDDKLRVSVFAREFKMSVRQIVSKFAPMDESGKHDWSNVSDKIKSDWETNKRNKWHTIRHYIYENDEFNPKKLESKFKKYRSVYIEAVSNENDDKVLSDKGYDYFPVLVPRWETNGQDVYGTDCPGMLALGDIKQLQLGEKRIWENVDKNLRPPLKGPPSLENTTISHLPGQFTAVTEMDGQGGLRPIYEVKSQLGDIETKQAQVRDRIRRAFFEDLFLMLSNDQRSGITAREIQERHEEKLLALGPVLEQLNQDLLDPLIEITFSFMVNQALIPEPPQELQGQPLKVEYTSVMAQAQKTQGIQTMERFIGFAGQVAQFSQESLQKIDFDQAIDIYADVLGVNPSVVRSDKVVADMRRRVAEAQAQQAQMQEAAMAVQGAKQLSETDMSGDNALNRLLGEGAPA